MSECPASPEIAKNLTPTELAEKAPVTQAKIKHHVFVCNGPSCSNNNSQATLEAFWSVLKDRGLLYGKRGSLEGSVIVTTCGSVGLCTIGPAVLIYPEGIWYYGVTPEDVPIIVDEYLIAGKIVQRLLAVQI